MDSTDLYHTHHGCGLRVFVLQLSCVSLQIKQLCLTAKEIFMSQPNLLELEAPIKICGKHRDDMPLLCVVEKRMIVHLRLMMCSCRLLLTSDVSNSVSSQWR